MASRYNISSFFTKEREKEITITFNQINIDNSFSYKVDENCIDWIYQKIIQNLHKKT